MRIYVASSWRNHFQPDVVTVLCQAAHEVYDFRNPTEDEYGFQWSSIDPAWKGQNAVAFREMLKHPIVEKGFGLDWRAMEWAECCVLVMPCGRSAHLEAGYFIGAGKQLHILLEDGEPELMYKMATALHVNVNELLETLKP